MALTYDYDNHIKRIKKKEYIIDKNGCWIWQLYVDKLGYGQRWHNKKVVRAHRIYYEKYKGKIPKV